MGRLVLASASPRRADLLRDAGYTFVVVPTGADESVAPGTPPAMAAVELAVRKARAAPVSADDIVLAADTLLDLDGLILGKPEDAADARRILAMLAGRDHWVCTGVCVRRAETEWTGLAQTRVTFRALSAHDIEDYVATGEPFGKAGAYAVQGKAGRALVASVQGPVDNVIGLPMDVVRRLLAEAGA